MKAADISDREMLAFILPINEEGQARGSAGWAQVWDLVPHWPGFPQKVVMAKAKQLVKRGLLDGCTCGCRGDFTVTEKGREFLARKGVEHGK